MKPTINGYQIHELHPLRQELYHAEKAVIAAMCEYQVTKDPAPVDLAAQKCFDIREKWAAAGAPYAPEGDVSSVEPSSPQPSGDSGASTL